MEQKILNYTSRDINIVWGKNSIKIPRSGKVKVKSEGIITIGVIGKVPLKITKIEYKVEGLPKEDPNTLIIVSRRVKNAIPHRKDLITPTEAVKDNEGHIIGYKSFKG